MRKISSFYIHNAGFKHLWFNDCYAPCCNLETGEPLHTMFGAGNGGGKSTAIALVMSTLVPERSKFLRSQKSAASSFNDYFDNHYNRPGFVVIEFDAGGEEGVDLFGKRSSIIVGQVVCLTHRDSPPFRFFFSFKNTGTLDIDTLLNGSDELPSLKEIKNLSELKAWQIAMRSFSAAKKHSADYYDTQNQDDWKRHLNSRRIDLDLAVLQWRYNKVEGGGEVKDANSFSDESDFFRRFMDMCLNDETADALKKNLEQGVGLLRKLPQYEKRLQVFKTLKEHYELFYNAAKDLQSDTSDLNLFLREAFSLLEALKRGYSEQKSSYESHVLSKKKFEVSSKQIKHSIDEMEAQGRGVQQAIYTKELSGLKQAYIRLKEHAKLLAERLELMEAKKALISIDSSREKISELLKQISIAGEEIAPYRDLVDEAGAKYRLALLNSKEAIKQAVEQCNSVIKCLKSAFDKLEGQEISLRTDESVWEKEVSKLGEFLEQLELNRKNLLKEGLLFEAETGEEAKGRLASAIADLEQKGKKVDEEVQFLENEIERVRDCISEKEKESEKVKHEAKQKKQEYKRGKGIANKLKQELIGFGLFDFEEPDLASYLVEQVLEERQNRLNEQAANVTIHQSGIEIDLSSLEQFNVLGVDHNVSKVVQALADVNVPALPYASYLAGIYADDPESAREIYLSDPARFSGVQVLNEEALVVAKSLSDLKLERPVVISPSIDKVPEVSCSSCVTISCSGDGLYNEKAAIASSKGLRKTLEYLKGEQVVIRREFQQISSWLTRRNEFLNELGDGNLDEIYFDRQRLVLQRRELRSFIRGLRKKKDKLELSLSQKSEFKVQLGKKIADITVSLSRVKDFVSNYESKHEDIKERLGSLVRKIEEVRPLLSKKSNQKRKVKEQDERFIKRSSWLEGEERRVDDRLKQVLHFSDEIYEVGTEFESYKGAYDEALDNLRAKESGVEKDLESALKNERELFDREWAAFKDKYKHLSEGDVRGVTVNGLDSAVLDLKTKIDEATCSAEKAKASYDQKKGQVGFILDNWKKNDQRVVCLELDECVNLDYLHAAAREMNEEISSAEKSKHEADRQAEEQGKLAFVADKNKQVYKEAMLLLENVLEQNSISLGVEKDSVQVPSIEVAVQVATVKRKQLNELTFSLRRNEERAQKAYNAFLRVLGAEDVRLHAPRESAYMLQAGRRDFEAFVEDADEKKRIIDDRIKLLRDSIERSDEDMQNCADALASGVEQGLRLLKRAVKFTIPESVPSLGGQPVLKINLSRLLKTKMPLSEYLKRFVKRLMSDDSAIPSGHRLVADAISYLAEQLAVKISVRILKPIPMVNRYDHVDICAYNSSSGGEGLTSALMYYLLAAHIRGMERGRSINLGGALILDNPIGEANLALLLQMQREFASSLGIQLIYFTGIKDLESLKEFNHHVTIRASQHEDRRTGRHYLEMWPIEALGGLRERSIEA